MKAGHSQSLLIMVMFVIFNTFCSGDSKPIQLQKTGGRTAVTTGGHIRVDGSQNSGGNIAGQINQMDGATTGGTSGAEVDGSQPDVVETGGTDTFDMANPDDANTLDVTISPDDAIQGDIVHLDDLVATGEDGKMASGCQGGQTISTCSKTGSPCTLEVNGTPRSFYVQLPDAYVSSKSYPVVFQFHPLGGSAEQAMNLYSIKPLMPEAIYVLPQGLKGNTATGWSNSDGQDIAFTKALLIEVKGKYCVDDTKVFAMGYDYGGMMSFAIGCQLGGLFRAIAPMAGALYSDMNCKGTGPAIAMWGYHGRKDMHIPVSEGRIARDKILKQNHCGTKTTPAEPAGCVQYQGCDAGYPVVWCEDDGYHGLPMFGNKTIAAFFKQF